MNDAAQAQQTWDEVDIDRVRSVAWLSLDYLNERLFWGFYEGKFNYQFVADMLAERVPEVDRKTLTGAAVVCGDMAGERAMFEEPENVAFTAVDGFDISPVSMARFVPGRVPFNPVLVDCNDLVLEADRYDLIVGNHGLHHVYNLGNLFFQCNKALKGSGLFYMNEWIGPPFLQIPRSNHVVAALLLWLLFPKGMRTNHMGMVKGRCVQVTADQFDPSEACNAPELMPQFLKYFRPLKLEYYGGLTYPVFEGIAQNIRQHRWQNKVRVRLVYWIERVLTRLGLIKPLFVSAVAERRGDLTRR